MPRRFFRRIVVAIEFPQERTQIALARAARIARATGARLLLFHSVYSPYATGRGLALPVVEQGIRQTIAERRKALEKLAAPLRRTGLKVSTAAAWDYPAFEAIVRQVLRTAPDLVIAESRRHAFGARLFLTNTDWQLIRLCPAPLLFVKQARAWRKLRVLASGGILARGPRRTHCAACRSRCRAEISAWRATPARTKYRVSRPAAGSAASADGRRAFGAACRRAATARGCTRHGSGVAARLGSPDRRQHGRARTRPGALRCAGGQTAPLPDSRAASPAALIRKSTY